jgi:ketosteroid isomerase-like protein
MNANENKETIRRIYVAMERGDLTAFSAAVHPDYIWRLAGHSSWSRRFEGQDAIRARLLKPLFTLFGTQYRAQAVNLVAEGDFVVAEVRGDVLTKGGRRYDNEYCIVFRFRGNKIAEVVEYCDTDLIERVLGPYEDALKSIEG